jgi:hypothetical protein
MSKEKPPFDQILLISDFTVLPKDPVLIERSDTLITVIFTLNIVRFNTLKFPYQQSVNQSQDDRNPKLLM